MKTYILFDSVGQYIKSFNSYQAALNWKWTFGNSGWYIK